MDIIHLLPDSVANQIAAGEVVQRPASVIKELMENAVDAGATTIDVLVQDAGRTSIQVIDDGKGMTETDARMAFERHATSKIAKAEDLFTLQTMGFRGEALPSIAAVSQVKLTTRTAEQELGVQLCLEGSRVVSQDVCSCPVGANFEVSNLFFNVPARRKFLKSNQTELNNIIQDFERIALVNPSVAFTLSSNGNRLMQLPAGGSMQRIVGIFGKKLGEQLLPLQVETSLVKISGFVGKPEAARKKNSSQYLFVNGRFMRHPRFHYAVMEAFSHLIPEGDQVPYFIFFQVDPANIDVNIHPTKTEIKFENEQEIWSIILAAVRDALGKFNAVPTIDFDVEGRPEIPTYDASGLNGVRVPRVQVNPGYNPFSSHSESRKPARQWEKLYEQAANQNNANNPVTLSPQDAQNVQNTPTSQASQTLFPESAEMSSQHYQYKGQYIMTAVQSGLMIVDQRRAHTRILYERYMRQMQEHNAATQGLLFPELLELSPSDAALLTGILDDIRALGFDITPLGGSSFSIVGAPSGQANPVAVVQQMVESVKQQDGAHADALHHQLALVLARNNAIEVGEALSPVQMETLVGDLFQCENPNLSPSGKTIITILQQEQIDKMFRTP
ncbi:MAG: DNA mismatch repair endonuclease MutL [Bacteroidaceae bacterium]|nr:DNA mismatch repair endonuclease MutL [Bacteroidaceae bacterium]